MTSFCGRFPKNGYQPLSCKPRIITSRVLHSHGQQNRNELFLLTKPNTIREHATLDLLYPIPGFIKEIKGELAFETRITSEGAIRVTDTSLIRVAQQ